MKNLLIILVLLLGSCSNKESIDPAFNVETLDQQLRGKPFHLSYSIDDLSVNAFGDELGDVPQVGGVFQQLASMFADISLDQNNGQQVEIAPVSYKLSELNDVDFSVIKEVSLDGVNLRIYNSDKSTSFSFIKKIEVYLLIDSLPVGIQETTPKVKEEESEVETGASAYESLTKEDEIGPVNEDSEIALEIKKLYEQKRSVLMLSFDRERQSLGCGGKCIKLNVHEKYLKKILEENIDYSIDIKLYIDEVPKSDMKLGGNIDFNIKLNLGF